MRNIVFALLLISLLSSQLRSATVESENNWDLVYDLSKEIRSDKSHSELRIQFILTCLKNETSTYYEERETICGSIHPTVTETTFHKGIDITDEEAIAFKSKLEYAGFFKLHESTQKSSKESDLFWYEDLTFRSGEQKIEKSYNYPPKEKIRRDVNEVIFSFIDQMGLDEPDEPLRIEAFVRGETISILSLELNDPLWNPEYYHGKIIKSIEVYEEQGTQKAIIEIVDNNDQVISIWNANIPDPNEGRARYEGKAAYVGKTIDFIVTNTKISHTEGDFEPSRKVTLQEILEDPDKFHGKRIRTRGFYDFQFEVMNLHDRRGNKVWIGRWSTFTKRKWTQSPLPNLLEAIFFGRHRGYATVEGIFLKGPSGHVGFWPGEIVRITQFDAHLKLDYLFWIILLAITVCVAFLIRKFRTKTRSTSSDKSTYSYIKA